MTLSILGPDPARRFTREHQSRAALARHSRTINEHVAFDTWLDENWNNVSEWRLGRFVSIVRRQIQRGDFAVRYRVTQSTLCDWLGQWRKAPSRSGSKKNPTSTRCVSRSVPRRSAIGG